MHYTLGALGLEQIIITISAIPPDVTSLNLEANQLGNQPHLDQILAAIPSHVTSLSLYLNALGNKTGTELAQALKAIPVHVNSLNLGFNKLGTRAGAELKEALTAIPATIRSLDLSNNELGNKTGTELAELFSSISTHIESLNLNRNNLCRLSEAELKKSFSAIATNVKSLHLSGNALSIIKANHLASLKDCLKHLEEIYLSFSEVDMMSCEQRAVLRKIFPNAVNSKIIFLDEDDEPLQKKENLAVSLLGFQPRKAPSLLEICGCFISPNKRYKEDPNIPKPLKSYLNTF